MTSYLLERAYVDGTVRDDVLVEVTDGRFTRVEPDHAADPITGPDPLRVPGLTLPGLANTHSHAFHRALRGRTQRGGGTFWTWREQMYALAARLDPATYHRLARAAYAEMAAAGTTVVGEFHYLHHRPDGSPYADRDGGPNAMGDALVRAAREVGIRVVLLDTCYLSSGFGAPPEGAQVRYDDGSAAAWAARATALAEHWTPAGSPPRDPGDGVRVGAAVHSVRAVPAEELGTVGAWADARHAPLHVHLSEQVAENDACRAAHGLTPTALLERHGLLGPRTTVVHATHLTDDDVAALGRARAYVSFCPTTERDLGDGIGPGRALAAAGVRLTLGSDSHAVVDPFEEARALELDERLATQRRGHWTAEELLAAAGGPDAHASLGFDDAGALAVGRRADLVTLATSTPRTAGTGADAHTAVFAATAADVRMVVADGRVLVPLGGHQAYADQVGADLAAALAEVDALLAGPAPTSPTSPTASTSPTPPEVPA